jgi:hypothetical protein
MESDTVIPRLLLFTPEAKIAVQVSDIPDKVSAVHFCKFLTC